MNDVKIVVGPIGNLNQHKTLQVAKLMEAINDSQYYFLRIKKEKTVLVNVSSLSRTDKELLKPPQSKTTSILLNYLGQVKDNNMVKSFLMRAKLQSYII